MISTDTHDGVAQTHANANAHAHAHFYTNAQGNAHVHTHTHLYEANNSHSAISTRTHDDVAAAGACSSSKCNETTSKSHACLFLCLFVQ